MSLLSSDEGKRLCSRRLRLSWALRMMDGVVLTPTLQEALKKSRGFDQQELLSNSDTRLDAHPGLRMMTGPTPRRRAEGCASAARRDEEDLAEKDASHQSKNVDFWGDFY